MSCVNCGHRRSQHVGEEVKCLYSPSNFVTAALRKWAGDGVWACGFCGVRRSEPTPLPEYVRCDGCGFINYMGIDDEPVRRKKKKK